MQKKLGFDVWFDLISQSYLNPPVTYNGKNLPAFPSDVIQENTTGQSGIPTLKEAFNYYKDCINSFEEFGKPIAENHQVLDFGAGWGRISRFFLRDIPLDNICGLDVMPEFTEICQKTFQSSNFYTCKSHPPTNLPDNHFDFIVGYSVFSHLSEEACMAWMTEFSRVLVPGGILALTTRGRPFFDYCQSLDESHTGYAAALRTMFKDFDAARAQYDRGEFVHSNVDGVSGGGLINNSFYGETFIPEAYARQAYSAVLSLEKFMFDASTQSHPILFFRKK